MSNTITVRSNGKLLLLGEYLALCGYAAIGLPIPLYTTAVYTHNNKPLSIHSDISIEHDFYEHVTKVCAIYSMAVPLGTITITSSIPIGSGFGSSAALCVCIAKILLATHSRLSLSTQHTLIWNIAHELEHFFHGTASGIDTALCTYNTSLLLEQTDTHLEKTPSHFKATPITLALKNHLVYSYMPRITPHAISNIVQNIQQNPTNNIYQLWIQAHNDAINTCKKIHNTTITHKEFLQQLGSYIHTIHTQIKSLQISIDDIDHILDTSRMHGSLGGKISGAGYGGAWFCLYETIPSKDDSQNTPYPLYNY